MRRFLSFTAAIVLAIGVGSSVAQAPKGIPVTRIFSGPDGETHAEEIQINLGTPRNGGAFSPQMKAENMTFLRRAASLTEEWHTAPRRQYAITLSGHAEMEIGGGKKVALVPGGILLIEDSTGKGHRVVTGAEEWTAAFIPVPAQ